MTRDSHIALLRWMEERNGGPLPEMSPAAFAIAAEIKKCEEEALTAIRQRRDGRNIALLFLLVVLIGCVVSVAHGQDHMRWHHYYQHWKQPGTTVSCCNARVIVDGKDIMGDCEPTRGEMRQGQWWFWYRQESRWIPIPDDRLIRERNPSGEEAHLCTRRTDGVVAILCAVPPDTGG